MTYDAVIFDVDGTLLDTSEGLISAVNYTIDVCGLTPLTESQLRTFIGPPIQNSLAKYYDLSPEKIQEIAKIFITSSSLRGNLYGSGQVGPEPY